MNKKSFFGNVILLFVLSRVFFLVCANLAPNITDVDNGYLGKRVAQGEPHFIWELANLDGEHFIKVATKGYSGTEFAYLPLYPITIGLVSRVTTLTPIYSGILVSIVSTVLAIYFITKLLVFERDRSSHETLLLLFFFPFSFILNSVYADALFLFLTTASFYYARKKNWWISGTFAFAASLTRFSGLALFPALIFEWWLQNGKPKFSIVIAPLLNFGGFFVYTLLLQINYGNWLLFQVSMRAWKQEKFISVLQVFFRYIKIFGSVSPNLLVYWVAVMEFFSFILYFVLAIYVYKKIRASYGVFMMVLLVLVSFTGTFAGTPRYLVHLFPAYFGLAKILNDHPRLRYIYYPATIALGVILTALFTQGHFVG